MITQISGCNATGVTKDPRRTSQHVQFKNNYIRSNISYKSNDNYNEEHERQQNKAFKTSTLIVLGSILFMAGYFMLSGLSKGKA